MTNSENRSEFKEKLKLYLDKSMELWKQGSPTNNRRRTEGFSAPMISSPLLAVPDPIDNFGGVLNGPLSFPLYLFFLKQIFSILLL